MSICRWLLQLCNPFHHNVHWTLSARKGFWGSVPHSRYYAVTSSWCNFSVKPCISMPCRHLQIRLVLLWLYPQPRIMQFAKIHLNFWTGIESWRHYLHFKSLTFPKSSWRWTMCPFDSFQEFQILRLASYERPWNTCTSVGLCTGTGGDGNRGQGSWEDGRPGSREACSVMSRVRTWSPRTWFWIKTGAMAVQHKQCQNKASFEGNRIISSFYILFVHCDASMSCGSWEPNPGIWKSPIWVWPSWSLERHTPRPELWNLQFVQFVQFVISHEIHRELSLYLCFGVSISMDV